jgi:hypothetical protein
MTHYMEEQDMDLMSDFKTTNQHIQYHRVCFQVPTNTCELCTCDFNLKMLASCSISLCTWQSRIRKQISNLSNTNHEQSREEIGVTFYISALETPCDSRFLTCNHQRTRISAFQFIEHLSGANPRRETGKYW